MAEVVHMVAAIGAGIISAMVVDWGLIGSIMVVSVHVLTEEGQLYILGI